MRSFWTQLYISNNKYKNVIIYNIILWIDFLEQKRKMAVLLVVESIDVHAGTRMHKLTELSQQVAVD